MSIKKLRLTRPASGVEVIVERKNIKKIQLRVFPNGMVKLSAPPGVLDEWIDDYLEKKTPWIEKSLDYFEATRNNELETRIQNGVSTRILGRQSIIRVDESKVYKIEKRGGYVYIQSPAAGDKPALLKQFERWWQKQSRAYFLKTIDRLYPIIAKYGIDKPGLQVRKMKTLWGSCSRKHGKINLNYYLYKAPPPCIDYVVLHEFIHFRYPKHDKGFYELLTVHMPDWKERKRILDYEIVKGLGY